MALRTSGESARGLIAAALLCGACGDGARERRPDILLISLDTLRADRLGCYGNPAAPTPALDALAARGVRFDRVLAPSPWTLPSHASLFTGRDVAGHGVRGDHDLLAPQLTTLAEWLAEAGYRTAAFTGSGYLHHTFGLARGFEEYEDSGGGLAKVGERAESWLRSAAADGPSFVFLHTYAMHSAMEGELPYRAAAADLKRYAADYPDHLRGDSRLLEQLNLGRVRAGPGGREALLGLYDAALATTDRALGELLRRWEAEGLLEGAVVCVVSDHGEGFLEHGQVGHASALYEEFLWVPWILTAPGLAAAVAEQAVSLIDVAPTLATLAGVETPAGIEGRAWRPAASPPPRDLYAEMDGRDALWPARLRALGSDYEFRSVALRRGPLKLLYWPGSGRTELFDLASDPGERVDLSAARPRDAELLRDAARRALQRPPAAAPQRGSGLDLELLRDLGYVER